MIRLILNVVILAGLAYGGWWAWNNFPEVKEFVGEKLHGDAFHTLEARFTADQIMQAQEKNLLRDGEHSFLKPELQFSPYLLMEVKYSGSNDQTREGMILWGMDDGEMVTSTETWEKTHGFEDCINAKADRNDFKVLNVLAAHGGAADRKQMAKELRAEDDVVDAWLNDCRKKRLVIQDGNSYRLHFQRPKLAVVPETRVSQWLVTKPYRGATRLDRRYSRSQIEGIARSAFGNNFTIRATREVFLPVYILRVQNPDGSVYTTFWNALTGTQMSQLLYN